MIAKNITNATTQLLAEVKPDTGKGANVSKALAELFMCITGKQG
jgi:hypothetical protein